MTAWHRVERLAWLVGEHLSIAYLSLLFALTAVAALLSWGRW